MCSFFRFYILLQWDVMFSLAIVKNTSWPKLKMGGWSWKCLRFFCARLLIKYQNDKWLCEPRNDLSVKYFVLFVFVACLCVKRTAVLFAWRFLWTYFNVWNKSNKKSKAASLLDGTPPFICHTNARFSFSEDFMHICVSWDNFYILQCFRCPPPPGWNGLLALSPQGRTASLPKKKAKRSCSRKEHEDDLAMHVVETFLSKNKLHAFVAAN